MGELLTECLSALPVVWVVGEVQRYTVSRNGHAYFQLVEKGEWDQVKASLSAVIFRTQRLRVEKALSKAGTVLEEGSEVRAEVELDFYPPNGRLQAIVREVDSTFSLGKLALRRREILESLSRRGLLDRNRGLELAALPLRVGLVASKGSAGYHDFRRTLEESPYDFRVITRDSAVQGAGAEASLVKALRSLQAEQVDVVVMVRGGGAKADLAAFDGETLAEAIAACPLPVLTGLGHQIDESVADRVAYRSFKTPTAVAEFLGRRLGEAEDRFREVTRRLLVAVEVRLGVGEQRLDRVSEKLIRSGRRIEGDKARLDRLAGALLRAARGRHQGETRDLESLSTQLLSRSAKRLGEARPRVKQIGAQLTVAARHRIQKESLRLEGWSRLSTELSPRRILERGFSLTLNSVGTIVRRVHEVSPGEEIQSVFADGRLRSRVEANSLHETSLKEANDE